MRRSHTTENRPEQERLYQLLFFIFVKRNKHFIMQKEYVPPNLKEVEGIKPYYEKPPRLDIAIIENKSLKIAYRIMGQIHEKRLRRVRDENQKVLLEGNGWKVIDYWFDRHEALWLDSPESRRATEKFILEDLAKL